MTQHYIQEGPIVQQWKMFMNFITFTSDHSHGLCLIRAAEADAQRHIQKHTIWQLTNEQSDPSQFTVSQHIEKKTDIYWDLLIEPEFWFTYPQPHHKHINKGSTDMHVGLLHGNTLSNHIHNIQITNKMHFNVYDVFYSLNSHQYVQSDTSIIIRIQRYKCCVVLLTLHHNYNSYNFSWKYINNTNIV